MKRNYCIIAALIFLIVFTFGTNSVTAKTLYDDFSGDYIDSSKWSQREQVREVVNGKLVSISRTDSGRIRNYAVLTNSGSVYAIKADVTPVASNLGGGSDVTSLIRVEGQFFNSKPSGGETGDVWAALRIVDRGNGLEADYIVAEALADDWSDATTWASDTITTGLSYNQTYTLEVEYDENQHEIIFTLSGVAPVTVDNTSLPANVRPIVGPFASVTTGFDNAESGVNTVHATFDNVYINNQGTVYDDFSTAPLDQTKWQFREFVREIDNGRVQLTSHSTGDRENTRLNFTEISPYIEATVRINSSSMIEPGDRGIARIDGYFYNDTYGPGSYNEYEGNIWSGLYINYYSDGTLKAACSGDRSKDAAESEWENLFYREFNLPIIPDRDYKLSIHLTESKFLLMCKDTVTGQMDVFGHDISTPIYKPYDEYRSLLSRVYGDTTGGYMSVEFDDVKVDVAEPVATFNATGDWDFTVSNLWADSGCSLPDADDANITITQNGNDLTLVVHDDDDITLTGNVYGDTYTFKATEENNGRTETIYGIITLSQNTAGTGSITFVWTEDVERCESGFEVALAKSAIGSDGGGGGGGGGCFISTMKR